MRLRGEVDPQALEAALAAVVERHEVLRTALRRAPGIKAPIQVVLDAKAPKLRTSEAEAGGDPERRHAVAELHRRDQRRPFDLEYGPMLRGHLLRFAPDDHHLLLSLSGVAADARTLSNLVAEVASAYAGGESDEEAVQYLQFSEWQHSLLDEEEAAAGRRYWQERSAADEGPPRLAFEAPPEPGSFVPEVVEVAAGARVEDGLAAALERLNAGVDDLVLACWHLLLGRLADRQRVTVRTHLDGRKFEELQEGFGAFARMLPVSSDLSGDPWFGEVLTELQKSLSEAAEWQELYLPPEEDGWEERSASAVGFEVRRLPPVHRAGGIELRAQELSVHLESPKLNLVVIAGGDALRLQLHYDPRRFAAADVERTARQLVAVLEQVVGEPDRRLGDLDVLAPDERRRLLVELNETAAELPEGRCLHHLLAAAAVGHGDDVAIEMAGGEAGGDTARRRTYAELAQRAGRIAARLGALGVGPEVRVGVHLPRSLELVEGLCGILRAGGAFVPLDAGYPGERLHRVFRDAGVAAVLTLAELAPRLEGLGVPVLRLDVDEDLAGADAAAATDGGVAPHHLAYVMYTSGSTGEPKGVMVRAPRPGQLPRPGPWRPTAWPPATGARSTRRSASTSP